MDIDEFDGNKVTSIIIAKQNGRGTVLSSVSYNQHNGDDGALVTNAKVQAGGTTRYADRNGVLR